MRKVGIKILQGSVATQTVLDKLTTVYSNYTGICFRCQFLTVYTCQNCESWFE